ncbi:DUF4118 domain-containing protein [uncultured Friedmanniella sp.]|uniref:DUF4118 domain-containing protein n=1 Tax=uncultured Friedmanniella sp. TaxID=335381 RepID=UPI0035CA3218
MSTSESSPWAARHAAPVWTAAAVAGPLVAGLLTPFRPHFDGSHVVLVLVLLVAAVSATGLRGAGVVAAVTTGLAFDYFWTQPYGSLAIGNAADVATVLLLVVVGVAIELLSWWGRRQHAEAARRQGYLSSLRLASATRTGEGDAHLEAVCTALTGLLDADRCTFVLGTGDGSTRLELDGTVTRDGVPLPVDREGLPTDDTLTLPVRTEQGEPAHFAVTASGHVARPSAEQRHVAALLATLSASRLGVAR